MLVGWIRIFGPMQVLLVDGGPGVIHHEDGLQPKWLAVEGFVKGGRVDAHLLTAQLLADKTAEWGDLADTFGTILCPEI